MTGLSGRASVTLVSQLVTRQLVEVDETDEETVYKLAPRLAELWERIDAPAHGRRAGAIEGISEGITEGISEGMTDRKARLADMIRQRPGLRGPQLSVALSLPASTVDRYLSQLRKEGRIEHRGARRTGGYFPRATKRA
ncbi:MAG: hypothetical protein IPP07_11085 [Holophagales bacterium]|nr:hypothetical protein [Holophagales bacterium]